MEMVIAQEKVKPDPRDFVRLGMERDKKIVQLISESGPYTRDQIHALFFADHKTPAKAVQRLTKLYKDKKLKRARTGLDEQYAYFTGRRNQKMEHAVLVNWVYVSLVTQRKSWFKIQAFVREYFQEWGEKNRLVSDALLVLKNTAKEVLQPYFVEVDRADSNNQFDKVKLYSSYFLSKAWTQQWWAKKNEEGKYRFPKVVVLTDRPEVVSETIKKCNKEKLRFKVVTLEQVRKDIYRHL
jgi:hypothetical protein